MNIRPAIDIYVVYVALGLDVMTVLMPALSILGDYHKRTATDIWKTMTHLFTQLTSVLVVTLQCQSVKKAKERC